MKKILMSALSLLMLATLLAHPGFAAVEADSSAPAPMMSASTTTTATPTAKEQVQAAVEGGGAAQKREPKPRQTFSRTPASMTPTPVTPASTTATTGGLGNILSPDTVALSAKELRALELSRNWAQSGPAPFLSGGKLTYIFGAGGIPTIIAAPMQIVDVELEAGEKINEIVTGDSARWLVEMGTAGGTTHLFIKPLDVGLESSLAVTTDRRVYHLRLVSKPKEHTPYVGFVYANDLQKQLAAHKADEAKQQKWQSTTDAGGATTDLAALNFNYSITGDAPWKPERVFDDGKKTYIQLPAEVSSGEMPTLLVKKGKRDQLVNYRVKGRTMEVDGLFETIVLVVGVNGGLFNSGLGGEKQQMVEITRRAVGKVASSMAIGG